MLSLRDVDSHFLSYYHKFMKFEKDISIIPIDIIKSFEAEIAALKKENQQLRSEENSVRVTHEEQREYRESQIRFRTIFETSRLGNQIISSDLKILQVNSAMVTLLGYDTKEDIIGTRILDYTPLDHHQDWEILQERLWLKATPSFSLETCLQKKDNSIIWCQVTSILFLDKGKTLGYTVIEDTSKQHELRMHKEEFINVASHELKTPITSLQACLQIMTRILKKETMDIGETYQTI